MEKSISETEKKLKDGNAKIAEKLGNTPDSAKQMSESQYDDQMSFILRHWVSDRFI